MNEHSTESATAVNLVGLESEIHVANIGPANALQRTSLVHAVLNEIERQYGQGRDRLEAAGGTGRLEFLPNGSRCYDDHDYVEYSTPALSDTVDAVAAVGAGDRIVQSAVEKVQEAAGDDVQLLATRNSTDHRGHSYAAHVNVRLSREGYERIFTDDRFFHGTVVPFFATLPFICGSGTVGGENGQAQFLTWQRGPFIKTLVGESTMSNRPLVNTRDECLSADPGRYARLHVIHLDANRAESAEFLKLGLMKLFAGAVECVGWSDMSFELENPIHAVRSVTRSPFQPLRLSSRKTATPLEIQRRFYEAFHRLSEHGRFEDRVHDAYEILAEVNKVLTTLERDPFGLIGSLDWITKFVWLEQFRSRHRLNWSDPRLKWADIQYHALSDREDLNLPEFRRVTSEERVGELINDAPSGSRACIRGTLLRRFGRELSDADWHWVMRRDGQTAYLLPDDPPNEAVQSAERAKTLQDFADFLDMDSISVARMVVIPFAARNDAKGGAETIN